MLSPRSTPFNVALASQGWREGETRASTDFDAGHHILARLIRDGVVGSHAERHTRIFRMHGSPARWIREAALWRLGLDSRCDPALHECPSTFSLSPNPEVHNVIDASTLPLMSSFPPQKNPYEIYDSLKELGDDTLLLWCNTKSGSEDSNLTVVPATLRDR